MASIESIKTDSTKEINGVWVDYSLGIRLKIARARNPQYQEVLRTLIEPLKKDIREEKTEIEDLAKVLLMVRARTILLDWENIEDKDNNVIQYSPAKAEEFFRDSELKDFYEFVVAVSENADQFKKDLVEDSEKN